MLNVEQKLAFTITSAEEFIKCDNQMRNNKTHIDMIEHLYRNMLMSLKITNEATPNRTPSSHHIPEWNVWKNNQRHRVDPCLTK